MSAVFTGNGLGLFNTSLSQLGSGLGGGAGIGQGRDAQYVNVATGNLVWQGGDEHLVFRGLAIGLTRTYNSLGQMSDVGADGWVTGFERRVALQGGTFNAAGSVMRRYTGDGAYQDFTYVSPNTYQSTAGDQAHDTLAWTDSNWVYVEGSTRREEGYADHADGTAQGRLTYLREGRSDGAAPVTWQVVYDASQRIAELRADDGTADGDALIFGYDGNGRLSSVSTREAGAVQLQVSYGYDSQGRLASVLTDLSPGNATDNTWDAGTPANNDNRLFRAEYSYEGASLRLTSVRQSDGTVVSYTYHADGRLKTVTRGDTNTNDADGIGETTSYSYGTATTTVTDSIGRSWVYAFDAAGQLTSLTAPAVDGLSDITTYQYDAAGNVTQAKTVRGAAVLSQVEFTYDTAGNVTWEWDGLGNAISRTWSASNQLLSLTRYTGVDPDRSGASLPTGGMTTRYIYDAQNRVRFVVDALGQVSEFMYATSGSGIGQQSGLRQYLGANYGGAYDLASLQGWATTSQKADSQLSELSYDAWGRLSQRTDYAVVDASGIGVLSSGAGITRYSYDSQGLLRQQITLRGAGRTVGGAAQAGSEQVDYIYDGMGRLLSTVSRQVGQSASDATTLETTYTYLDSDHQVVVTDDAGEVTVQTRDAAGRLISVSEQGMVGGSLQTRSQMNYYDAAGQLRASEDAGGGRVYYFYDAKGRLMATVDATGAVSRTTYDGAGRVLGTRQYANRVTTSGWLVGGEVVPTTITTVDNDAMDRVTARTYDGAGRLITETDGLASSASRAITVYTHDAAGRVLQVRTTDSAGTEATARTMRYFYDAVGHEVGQLDAAGYLTETQYDRAGRVVVQTRYATVSPAAQWASGTLAQLRPGANAKDQTTRHYYDGRGRQVGQLDAQGYLTEWIYDESGNARAERRFATALTWSASDTLASLRSRAGAYREQRMAYSALGQLVTRTDVEGTVTRYTYDEAGRLIKTEAAHGTSEVREGHLRYNVFGELVGELGGESAPQVLPGMTETQLDAVYAQYGVRHGYDVLGRRIESIDAAGNRTWYFYDAAGRNTFTVRGVADGSGVANAQGEVSETRYNAFGDMSDQIAYTGRITLAIPGSRDSAQAAVSVLSYAAATDTRHQYAYTARGQLAHLTDAEGAVSQYTYDAFGHLQQQVQAYGATAAMTLRYEYDARGLQTLVTEGVGTSIERSRAQTYDAFGRVVSTVDARGVVRSFTYDRLGRQLTSTQMVQGQSENTSTAYDAHGRVVSVTDEEGQVTTYAHDDATRSLTVTSPEGVVVKTVHDRHGQTVQVVDAAGTTVYAYDRNGQLTSTERKAGNGTVVTAETREYDTARGLLTAVTDGRGRRVEYQYDAVGRVLRRIQSPAGLAAVTAYAYDGQGRELSVTDPSGRITSYQYDREGRLTQTALDPSGLNLRTQYSYDAQGRQISVIEGAGTTATRTTRYTYDVLGRRTSDVIDAGTGRLNLTTGYAYDANDNLIRRTDANDKVTRYYYDEANQQVYTVDPLGAITRQWYDRVGQVVAVRSFVQATNASTLTDATTLAQLEGRLTFSGNDQGQYRVYDADGKARFVLDLGGGLIEHRYDSAGRMVATRGYATAYSPGTLEAGLRAGTVDPSQIVTVPVDARDQQIYYVLDAAGQTRLTIDAVGNVRQLQYDASGRVVGSVAHAQPITLTTTLRNQLQAGTSTEADILAKVTASPALDRADYRIYDAAGRQRYTLQAATANTLIVRQHIYDAVGQVVAEVAYAVTIASDTAKTVMAVATALDAAGGGAADQQRVTRFVHDAAGRLRFQMDDVGAVTELRYNSLGQVLQSRRYAQAVSTATVQTEAGMAAAVAGQSGVDVRLTQTAYDTAGRVKSVTDAAGKVESYGYDALGRRTSLTNKLGHVWTYAYDAAGRLVEETSPPVTVATSTVAGAITTATRSVKTTMTYDALGNVTSRTEDAGAAQPRTTQYQYDSRGHQIKTIFPDAWQVNGSGQLVATGQAPTVEVSYDALGQAVVQKDVRGNYTYKVYDSLGRVVYEVDPEQQVTGYAYNAFGEQSRLKRFATKLNFGGIAGFVEGNALTLPQMASAVVVADAANDRELTTTYDQRGLKTKVTQSAITYVKGDGSTASASPTTQFTYNAFADLTRTSVLLDASASLWAHSWQYYDELGRNTLSVDAEGYVTQTQYNALGEVVQVKEYAKALSATTQASLTPQAPPAPPAVGDAITGYDRVVTYIYDAMGRKASESVLRHYARADGSQGVRPVATQWTYDAAGQAIITDVQGQQTRTTYDALGRVTAVQEAAQQRLASNAEAQLLGTTNIGLGTQSLYVQASAYTALAYDAFGNAVRTIRYANGLLEGQSAPVADASNDQVSVVAYDRQGRAVMNQDAAGNKAYLQYDAADNIVHSWYALTAGSGDNKTVGSYHTYDAVGRQLTSRTERVVGDATLVDQTETVRYNAFGEIVAKGNDASTPASYQYNRSGNLVGSNAEGGAWRDYGYNLAGHQVREAHAVYMTAGTNVTAVTRYTTDRLGRTVAMLLPSHTTDVGQENYLSRKVDRWGNVVELVDPRGYQTNYQYNDRNQVVKEIRPLVKVVTTSEEGAWQRPEQTWSYDELGRLVASVDGNGNATRYEYDGVGKLTKVIDANGSVTLNAYDALGRERISQDALGYLSFKQYDRLDRINAHGDYLPSASGAARTKKVLESYVLNQNGQRVQVINALNYITRYDYDSRGLLVRSQTPTGVVMEYGYDPGGRRSLERYALSHANVVDRDGETVRTNEQSWDYDYFGRLIDRNDLAGNDYNYTYDISSGQLKSETNNLGLNRITLYTASGQVREIQESNGVVYRYEYDQAGNRTMEYAEVKDSRGKQYKVRTNIVYDSHSRIQRVTQDDLVTSKRVFELTYDYDAAGNRTHVVARTGYGENTAPIDASDAPPTVIGKPANRTVRTGIETEFRVRLSDLFRDPEGKLLEVTAKRIASGAETTLPSWLTYSIDTATGEAVFLASTGSSAVNGQTFTLLLKANDGSSAVAVDFLLSVRSNTVPVDKAGAITSFPIKTGRPWALELAATDYFTDEDLGDTLAITGTVSPSASWLTIDPENPSVLRLSASAPVAGTYTLTLKATDQLGATKTRTVTLKVSANAAPALVAGIPNQNAVIGREFLLEKNLAEVFVDSHGDSMTMTATLPNGNALPSWLNFSYVQDLAMPQLRFSGQVPAGIADGTVIQVRLTATDTDGLSGTTSFDVVVKANRAPTVLTTPATQALRIYDDLDLQIPMASLFNDPEGDALIYEILYPQGTGKSGWIKLEADYTTGMLRLHGTPDDSSTQTGQYSVQIRARDPEEMASTVSINFNVGIRTPPSPNYDVALPTLVGKIGRTFNHVLPDNIFLDPDGDLLEYTLLVGIYHPATPPIGGELGEPAYWQYAPLPQWLEFDKPSKTLRGTVPTSETARTFTLMIRASDGRSLAERDFDFSVQTFVNSAPVYNTGTLPNRTAKHGSAVSYTLPAGAFTEPDGDPLTYSAQVQINGAWVSLGQIGLSISTATGKITGTATNLTQASYSVRIIASDPQGASNAGSIGTFTLNVTNTPPTVDPIPDQDVYRNASWSYGVAGFFSDVNQNQLTYSATGLPSGLSINSSTGVISGKATVVLGSYTTTITANDGRGGTVSTTLTLDVINAIPGVVTPIPNQTAPRNRAFSYTFPAGTFADVNGDSLTYSASNLPAGVVFNSGTRTFSGTPTTVGVKTVTVIANDGQGGTVSTTFKITVTNTAPTVVTPIPNQTAPRNRAFSFTFAAGTFTDYNNDTLTYSVGTLPPGITFDAATRKFSGTPTTIAATTVTVTANDGHGGTVSTSFQINVTNTAPTVAVVIPAQSASRGKSFSYTFPVGVFTDYNNDTLTYTASNLPAGITFNSATRTFSGTPTALGARAVTVTANDGHGGTVSTTFTFTIINDPPVYVGGLPNRSGNEAATVSWPLPSGTFTDPNGDALSYTLMVERPGYEEEYIGPFNEPLRRWHDPVWISSNSLTINASTGAITGSAFYLSLPGEAGPLADGRAYSYRVKIIASDGLKTAEGIFSLSVNKKPQAVTVPAQTAKQGAATSITLPAFKDDGSLTYSVTGLPAGLSFTAATRVISGTPTASGTFTITYSAKDAGLQTASTTFTLTVAANHAPTAPTIANLTITRDTAFSKIMPGFTDSDYDQLTYTMTGLPPGLVATGAKISGTPTTAGTYTVTYTAKDGRGGTASTTFKIIVNPPQTVNQPPVVQNPIMHQWSMWNRSWSFVVPENTFYDPNGDTLTYSASGMPSGMTFDPATRRFAMYTPKSTQGFVYNITVTVTDGRGGTVSDTFQLQVEPWEIMGIASGEEQQFVQGEELPAGEVQPSSLVAITQDAWYAYDKLGQVVVSNGQLVGGQVVLKQGGDSYGVSYDEVGNAVAQQRWTSSGSGSDWVMKTTQQVYSLRKQLTLSLGGAHNTTRYVYDDAGRLTERTSYFATGTKYTWIDDEGNVVPVRVDGMLASHEANTYDADGRLVSQVQRSRSGEKVERFPFRYPANPSQMLLVWVGQAHDGGQDQFNDLAVLTDVATLSYSGTGLGYDAAGRLQGYTYQSNAAGTANDYTHTYKSTYMERDGYLESQVKGTSSNGNYKITTSTMTFDVAGRQTEIREHSEGASALDDRVRSFAYNGDGLILSRRDGSLDGSVFKQNNAAGQPATGAALGRMNLHNVYANGQQVAGLDEAGKLDVLSRLTAFSSSASGRAQVVVQAGETLQSLAQRVYGNGGLWYVIAGANGLESDADLVAGASLTVPEVRTSSNDASTFKPYNPGEITGPTSPGLPYIAPPDAGCGTLGIVIMVAVIIVVSVYTAGAASGAAGTASGAAGSAGAATGGTAAGAAGGAAAGASASTSVWSAGLTAFSGGGAGMTAGTAVMSAGAGAFAGSVVGQGVGSLMGVASFSWRNALVSGASSMATAGMGALIQGGQLGQLGEVLNETTWARAAAQATMSNMTSYAASRVAGIDVSFSWRSVAASAVSAAISTRLGEALNLSPTPDMGGSGSFWKDVGNGLIGGATNLHTRRALGFGDAVDYGRMAADAFGNALGNATVRGAQNWQANRAGKQPNDQMQNWATEDDLQRQQMIAAEDQSRLPSWSSSQGGIYDASVGGYNGYPGGEASSGFPGGEVRPDQIRLPDIGLAQGGRPGPVVDNQPVLVEALPDDYPRTWTRTASGGLQRIMTPELQSRYREDQIRYYGERFSRGVFNAVAEPVRMVGDLGKVVYSVAMTEATSRLHEVQLSSAMARAVEGGATTGELLHELNPVYGLLVAQHEIRGAIARDDWGSVIEMGGGLAAGLALTRRGSGVRTFGAVVDVAGETAALRRIANLNATPEALSLHARINARGIPNNVVPAGSAFEGTLYRAVGEGYDPLLIHPRNVATSHRYTGPGQGGLYFATGRHVVEAEFVNNGASLAGTKMWAFSDQSLPGLLDLSNPSVRNNLGVSLSDLTRTGGTQAWRYEVTQPLGDWAQQTGYRGVIAPSAQADGGVNLILFDPWGVK